MIWNKYKFAWCVWKSCDYAFFLIWIILSNYINQIFVPLIYNLQLIYDKHLNGFQIMQIFILIGDYILSKVVMTKPKSPCWNREEILDVKTKDCGSLHK